MSNSDNKSFHWDKWQEGLIPPLEEHSEKKLDLLRDYLIAYLQIVLAKTRGKEVQEITLIDGFAGGGIYQANKYGSPIAILEAAAAAEALINADREIRTRIRPICYFVEKNPEAYACLNATLSAKGYGDRIGRTIHLRNKPFDECIDEIVLDINTRHNRGGNRTIFFLDQCGWSRISAPTIASIAQRLHGRPEFIINFAMDWLTDHMSAKTISRDQAALDQLGLAGAVDVQEMLRLQLKFGGDCKHAVEAHIGTAFHKASNVPFFSPFYIEPKNNHRGYWLLHLAGSTRARSAMADVHWQKANRSKHYGNLGLDMLSYKPTNDDSMYIQGMSFGDESRAKCISVLGSDLARLLRDEHGDGITYEEFVNKISNRIVASSPMLNEVLFSLCQTSEFEVRSPRLHDKRSQSFRANDILMPRKQFFLPGMQVAKPPA